MKTLSSNQSQSGQTNHQITFYADEDFVIDRFTTTPMVNIFKNESHLIIEVAIPGIDSKNVKYLVQAEKLILFSLNEDYSVYQAISAEYDFSRFKRIIELPVPVNPNGKITKKYKKGIFQLVLPINMG